MVFLFVFFKNILTDTYTCPILGPLIPLFWISGDVSSGFQSQSGLPYSPPNPIVHNANWDLRSDRFYLECRQNSQKKNTQTSISSNSIKIDLNGKVQFKRAEGKYIPLPSLSHVISRQRL